MHREVVRILTYEWNPTRQPPEVLVQYDYSAYAPEVEQLIKSGASKEQLADELFALETGNMKLEGDRARCIRVAELLVRLRQK